MSHNLFHFFPELTSSAPGIVAVFTAVFAGFVFLLAMRFRRTAQLVMELPPQQQSIEVEVRLPSCTKVLR